MHKPLAAFVFALVFVAACGGEEELASQVTGTPPVSGAPSLAPSTPAPAPVGTQPTPTPAWKTLTNTDYGFSLQYPADWYLDVHGTYPDTRMDYTAIYNFPPARTQAEASPPTPGQLKIEFYVLDNSGGLSLDQWVADFIAKADTPTTVVSTSELQIGGSRGVQEVLSFAGANSYSAFFSLKSKVLFINGPSVDSPLLDIYQTILRTLKFG